MTIPDLRPYTKYEVRLQACIRNVLNGCGTSGAAFVTTLEDKPQGMMEPGLSALGPNAVDIIWQPPSNPNGVITRYRVYQRMPPDTSSEILINQVPGTVQEFLHSGQDLKPYTVYEYRVSFSSFTVSFFMCGIMCFQPVFLNELSELHDSKSLSLVLKFIVLSDVFQT